jgi:hypothetical protein
MSARVWERSYLDLFVKNASPRRAQFRDPFSDRSSITDINRVTTNLTPDGNRLAIFYVKLHNRLLRPLTAANAPPAPYRYVKRYEPSTATSRTTSPRPA